MDQRNYVVKFWLADESEFVVNIRSESARDAMDAAWDELEKQEPDHEEVEVVNLDLRFN